MARIGHHIKWCWLVSDLPARLSVQYFIRLHQYLQALKKWYKTIWTLKCFQEVRPFPLWRKRQAAVFWGWFKGRASRRQRDICDDLSREPALSPALDARSSLKRKGELADHDLGLIHNEPQARSSTAEPRLKPSLQTGFQLQLLGILGLYQSLVHLLSVSLSSLFLSPKHVGWPLAVVWTCNSSTWRPEASGTASFALAGGSIGRLCLKKKKQNQNQEWKQRQNFPRMCFQCNILAFSDGRKMCHLRDNCNVAQSCPGEFLRLSVVLRLQPLLMTGQAKFLGLLAFSFWDFINHPPWTYSVAHFNLELLPPLHWTLEDAEAYMPVSPG